MKKLNKNLIIILALCVIAVFFWYIATKFGFNPINLDYSHKNNSQPIESPVDEVVRDSSSRDSTIAFDINENAQASWKFTLEGFAFGGPVSKVEVLMGDEIIPVGYTLGNCARESRFARPNSVSTIQCWWAGGGDVFQVVKSEDTYSVEYTPIGEGIEFEDELLNLDFGPVMEGQGLELFNAYDFKKI